MLHTLMPSRECVESPHPALAPSAQIVCKRRRSSVDGRPLNYAKWNATECAWRVSIREIRSDFEFYAVLELRAFCANCFRIAKQSSTIAWLIAQRSERRSPIPKAKRDRHSEMGAHYTFSNR